MVTFAESAPNDLLPLAAKGVCITSDKDTQATHTHTWVVLTWVSTHLVKMNHKEFVADR